MNFERYDNLRNLVQASFSQKSQIIVDKALDFASERLSGLSRYDGNPMLSHGVNVAQIVISDIGLGINSTVAAILHDTIRLAAKGGEEEELVEVSSQIRELFGDEVLAIAMGLCNISQIKFKTESQQADDFRELIISKSTDPRVILIKLADRLEVMRNLEIFPPKKWHKKSWESLHLYAQIAHKLGLYTIKSELEDISLRYLESAAYKDIQAKLSEGEDERKRFIEQFVVPIQKQLESSGMKFHIKSRTKSIYSIWNKIYNNNIPFENIFDIFAIRIVIDCPKELEKQQCWMAYSLVSDCYMPNPERLKDWITIPKSNGYESLHTTVAAGGGRWVEIQIRTERMDAVAECGIAAHWRYKGVNQGTQGSEMWLERLRELMDVTTESIADRLDAKQASDEIFIFTPNGDIRKMSEGATLLDFAFEIHSGLGCTCVGGRINSRSGSIREVLKSGDIVEILTQKNQTPKADWLNIVTTTKARNKIKSVLREEKAKEAQIGREELERKIKNWKINVTIDDAVNHLCKEYKVRTGMQIYEMIALQKVDLAAIKEQLLRLVSGEAAEERRAAAAEVEKTKLEKANIKAAATTATANNNDALQIEDGINNLDYKLGRCCNPIKGDEIFGFVTVSAGITIHRNDCPNACKLRERYPYRVMEASWRSSSTGAFRVTIAVMFKDSNGVTNQITEVISRQLKLSIRNIAITSRPDGIAAGTITIEVPSTGVVDTLIHSIMRVKGVTRVYRTNK
ncbi:MAG: RelA/SpoT family protein [Rikenellaceae bacterium]